MKRNRYDELSNEAEGFYMRDDESHEDMFQRLTIIATDKNPSEPRKRMEAQKKLPLFREPFRSSTHTCSDRQFILDILNSAVVD